MPRKAPPSAVALTPTGTGSCILATELGYSGWALRSALVTLLLVVGTGAALLLEFSCLQNCGSRTGFGPLLDVSWVGFLTGAVGTTVLAARALAVRREDNRALLALVIVLVPFVPLGGVFTLFF